MKAGSYLGALEECKAKDLRNWRVLGRDNRGFEDHRVGKWRNCGERMSIGLLFISLWSVWGKCG